MNEPAFQDDKTWKSEEQENAQAQILQSWRESKENPGKYLKQLRELKGRSLVDLASELGVSNHQVTALENDVKEDLPAPIYVKSYIKRYCLALGISESEIRSVLDDMAKEVLPTLNRVSLRKNNSPRQSLTRWLGYGVGIIAVVLLISLAKSIDFSGLWSTFSSPSTEVPGSTATELSLPIVTEESDAAGSQDTK